MVKKHDPIQDIQKIYAKQFSLEDLYLKKYEDNSKDNKALTKTNISIPRLEALTLTIYSPNIYNIFISL